MEESRHVAELWLQNAVQWLRLGVETMGAAVVAVGIVMAAGAFIGAFLKREPANFNKIRINFARYLALALEFQLGADILSTAIAPGWQGIQKLAAIAVIRTGLNYFLMKEMEMEHERRHSAENSNFGQDEQDFQDEVLTADKRQKRG